jgi:hypothetical protein
MFRLKMITFCKSAKCPTSEDLLSFERAGYGDGLPVRKSEEIWTHLTGCEFCAAELEFYARYPQTADEEDAEETTARVEIPLPLYELAKALLNNKHKDFSLLDSLK